MSLDPAAYPELWKIFAKTGGDLRPEYLLPVMYGESSLSPNAENADHYGLNQIDGDSLRSRGIDPADYKTWPASRQLRQVVGPFFENQVQSNGPIRSGTRLYQANFLPATLALATDFQDTVVAKGGKRFGGAEASFYDSNIVLDIGTSSDPIGRDGLHHKGRITVGDLAARVAAMSQVPAVEKAIALAYQAKPPGVTAQVLDLPHNPVDGEDYTAQGQYVGGGKLAPVSVASSASSWPLWLGGGVVVAAGVAAWWYLGNMRENPISGSEVQSLLFRRDTWTVARARAWARKHGYRSSKVDVTQDYVRLRQAPPGRFDRMRTREFGHGIQAVVGFYA